MDLKNIFLLLSQKGIDNVNLEMLPSEQKKEIYEGYAELFKDEYGKNITILIVKAYTKAKNLEKIKERLKKELDRASSEKYYKYCYYCCLLSKDEQMTKFFEQFINDGKDYDINYTKFYEELKKEINTLENGNL